MIQGNLAHISLRFGVDSCARGLLIFNRNYLILQENFHRTTKLPLVLILQSKVFYGTQTQESIYNYGILRDMNVLDTWPEYIINMRKYKTPNFHLYPKFICIISLLKSGGCRSLWLIKNSNTTCSWKGKIQRSRCLKWVMFIFFSVGTRFARQSFII